MRQVVRSVCLDDLGAVAVLVKDEWVAPWRTSVDSGQQTSSLEGSSHVVPHVDNDCLAGLNPGDQGMQFDITLRLGPSARLHGSRLLICLV